jgi:hypothetical protein
MKTFQEIYCHSHRCEPQDFNRRVFWRCLYPQAFVIAPLMQLTNSRCFELERELIERVGSVFSRSELDAELKHFNSRRQLSWLQRRAGIRISTRRLSQLGQTYLTDAQIERPTQSIGLRTA